MELENIKGLQFSLLKKEEDLEAHTAEYTKKVTAKFTIPSDLPKTEEMFELLVQRMYNDLMEKAPEDVDSLGLWIERDTDILDNAISLQTLKDIKDYSKEKIIPVYEFFKMTLMV
jgi:hypothetical protein